MGDEWEQSPGHLMHISVGYGPMLWGVDQWNEPWYKMLGMPKWEDRETETHWVPLFVKMEYLDVGYNGFVWALDSEHTLFWREGVTEENKFGDSFVAKDYDQGRYGNLVGLGYCTNG